MIRLDEVLLIFGKWKEENANLKVLGYFPTSRFLLNDCRMLDFSSDAVSLLLPGDRNACVMLLSGLVFEYGEPPEGEGEGTRSALIARGIERERTVFFIELIQ